MTDLLSVLEKWGINVPEEADYYVEFLRDSHPSKFYYIDQCPFSVGEKHSEVDMFFQEVLEGSLPKEKFMALELKYRNILTKIWLYNNVYVESNICDKRIKNKSKKIDKEYRHLYSKLVDKFSKDNFVKITDKSELELLVQLGNRDVNYTAYYFQEYELLIIPSWSCFIAYFNDISKLNIVEKIVNTEGLYLRPFIETQQK